MTNRMTRVCELIKRELGPIISREFDFGGALVTVNDVDITPDLRQGFVHVGVIGGKSQGDSVVQRLNDKSGLIWKRLTERVVLKYTPRLSFRLDTSVERGVRVLNAIEEVDDLPLAADTDEFDDQEPFEDENGYQR